MLTATQKVELERRLAAEREAAKPHVIVHDQTIMGYGTTLALAWEDFEEYHGDIYPADDEEARELLEALRLTEQLAAQFDGDGGRNLDPSDGWIQRNGLADIAWS